MQWLWVGDSVSFCHPWLVSCGIKYPDTYISTVRRVLSNVSKKKEDRDGGWGHGGLGGLGGGGGATGGGGRWGGGGEVGRGGGGEGGGFRGGLTKCINVRDTGCVLTFAFWLTAHHVLRPDQPVSPALLTGRSTLPGSCWT